MWGKIASVISKAGKARVGKDVQESIDSNNSGKIASSIINFISNKWKIYAILAACGAFIIIVIGILVVSVFNHNFSPYSASDQTNTEEKEDWQNFFDEIGELNTSEEFCTDNLCTSYDEKQIYEKQKSIYIRYKDIYDVEITFPFIVGTSLYNEDTDEYYPKLTEDCIGGPEKCEDEQFSTLDREKVKETVVEQGYGAYVDHIPEYIKTNAPYEADQILGHWAWDNFYDDEPDENSAVLRFDFDYEAKDLSRLSKGTTKKETTNTCTISGKYTNGQPFSYIAFSHLYDNEENYSVKDVHSYFGDLKLCEEMAAIKASEPGVASASGEIDSVDKYELDKQKYDNYLYNIYLRDKYYEDLNEVDEQHVDFTVESMMYDIYGQFDYYLDLMYGEEGPSFEVEKWEKREKCSICEGLYDKGYDPEEDRTVTNSMVCEYIIDGQELNNLKVQILDCDTEEPVGELVDFEKYILGVSYGELGTNKVYEEGRVPEDAIKAHAIAARSFALARAKERGNITQQNGEWVLSIKSCTDDQVYCDPDLGCHVSGDKSELSSGAGTTGLYYKGVLTDDWFRETVASTAGQVILNNNGNIIQASYGSVKVSGINWNEDGTYNVIDIPNSWYGLADSGLDYNEILMKGYQSDGINSIGEYDCSPATGDWENWKQFEGPWANQIINQNWKDCIGTNKKTIKKAGCALTSVAILMAKSGVELNESFVRRYGSLNPGTFAAALSDNGGFHCNSIYWAKTTVVSSNFQNVLHQPFKDANNDPMGYTGSTAANLVAEQIAQGRYVVIGVNNSSHYVAVEKVVGNDIYVYDPGKNTNGILSQLYPNDNGAIYQIDAYKATR